MEEPLRRALCLLLEADLLFEEASAFILSARLSTVIEHLRADLPSTGAHDHCESTSSS
jgi:hypothetical protein